MEEKINTQNLKLNQLERKIESIELINKLYSDALYEIVRMGRKSEPKTNQSTKKKYAGFADTVLNKKILPPKIDFNSI